MSPVSAPNSFKAALKQYLVLLGMPCAMVGRHRPAGYTDRHSNLPSIKHQQACAANHWPYMGSSSIEEMHPEGST